MHTSGFAQTEWFSVGSLLSDLHMEAIIPTDVYMSLCHKINKLKR